MLLKMSTKLYWKWIQSCTENEYYFSTEYWVLSTHPPNSINTHSNLTCLGVCGRRVTPVNVLAAPYSSWKTCSLLTKMDVVFEILAHTGGRRHANFEAFRNGFLGQLKMSTKLYWKSIQSCTENQYKVVLKMSTGLYHVGGEHLVLEFLATESPQYGPIS